MRLPIHAIYIAGQLTARCARTRVAHVRDSLTSKNFNRLYLDNEASDRKMVKDFSVYFVAKNLFLRKIPYFRPLGTTEYRDKSVRILSSLAVSITV